MKSTTGPQCKLTKNKGQTIDPLDVVLHWEPVTDFPIANLSSYILLTSLEIFFNFLFDAELSLICYFLMNTLYEIKQNSRFRCSICMHSGLHARDTAFLRT